MPLCVGTSPVLSQILRDRNEGKLAKKPQMLDINSIRASLCQPLQNIVFTVKRRVAPALTTLDYRTARDFLEDHIPLPFDSELDFTVRTPYNAPSPLISDIHASQIAEEPETDLGN
ncbi:transcription factor [Moniliophthora roreri]|nr:transcription factor [Moniliophthora roreri]